MNPRRLANAVLPVVAAAVTTGAAMRLRFRTGGLPQLPRTANKAVVAREGDVELKTWSDPVRGEAGFRTLLGGAVRTGEFTAGVAELEVGGWLGHHRHEPSEVYYVLSGEGTLRVDGQEHQVRAGSAVWIPGNSEHGIQNSGGDRLRFFYVFAVDSFEQIEYVFTSPA